MPPRVQPWRLDQVGGVLHVYTVYVLTVKVYN